MNQLELLPQRLGIAGAALSPEQKRFNSLVGRLAQARALLTEWHEAISRFRADYVAQQLPLQAELRAANRRWVFALDAAAGRHRWGRADETTIGQLVCEVSGELLDEADDPEVKALYNRWAETDFDAGQAEELLMMKQLAEAATGLDLGSDDDLTDEEDLERRMRESLQAAAAAEAAQSHAASPRRKTAAQKRKESESHEVTLSVREVFRKLASALHPDRETDPAERAAKTLLMQQANRAYAANDLLSLLELQLRIEQIDNPHLAAADARRLKHYNKVLADQLQELRRETDDVVTGLMFEFGIDLQSNASPRRLGAELSVENARMRAGLQGLEQQIRMFDDAVKTKRWLKAQRRRMRDEDQEDEDLADLFR